MAARPSWRGQIRLALVAIPVEIFPATKSGRSIAFHQIHEPSGQRVRYEKTVAGIGPVDRDEILKGYEVSAAGKAALGGLLRRERRVKTPCSV
jgi:DNA end-binding protein Ku